MGINSGIAWTDDTLNAIAGCSLVSPGCVNCYARYDIHRMANNPKFNGKYKNLVTISNSGELKWNRHIKFFPERLEAVLRTRKSRKYFTNSLSDLFFEGLEEKDIQKHFKAFRQADWHIFQILTKRSSRLRKLNPKIEWPDNVWMGDTVEDSERINRIPDLLATQAKIKWISFEPWLSNLDVPLRESVPDLRNKLQGIHWAVIGGESSKGRYGARPMLFDDVQFLIDECRAAGLTVFLKQLGTVWAVASGTYNETDSEGKKVKKSKSGGRLRFGPRSFVPRLARDPGLCGGQAVTWSPDAHSGVYCRISQLVSVVDRHPWTSREQSRNGWCCSSCRTAT